jgi:hypothetical protein
MKHQTTNIDPRFMRKFVEIKSMYSNLSLIGLRFFNPNTIGNKSSVGSRS